MNKNKEILVGDLRVKYPSSDINDWYTIEQQSFTVDKGEYILKEFSKDFPGFKVDDFQYLLKVINRSKTLREWYARTSLLYANTVQLPVGYKDLFEPNQYLKMMEDMTSYKNNLVKESEEIEKISNEFTNNINNIRDKYRSLNEQIVSKNKLYPILTLTGEDLPLSIQMEIEGYSPATGDISNSQKAFSKELLIQYKRALINKVKENPNIDIVKVIDANRLK